MNAICDYFNIPSPYSPYGLPSASLYSLGLKFQKDGEYGLFLSDTIDHVYMVLDKDYTLESFIEF